jgi:hypothetical protein
VFPVVEELGVALALEDLHERCALERGAGGVEDHDAIAFEDHGVAAVVGVVVAAFRSVGVAECVPSPDDLGELDACSGAGVAEQFRLALDGEVAGARVGVQLGDFAHLVDPTSPLASAPATSGRSRIARIVCRRRCSSTEPVLAKADAQLRTPACPSLSKRFVDSARSSTADVSATEW